MIKVGCAGVDGSHKHKEYNFDINREMINRITCFDGTSPSTANGRCNEQPSEFLECGEGQPYIIEMFDASIDVNGSIIPLSTFKVTEQMMECMVDDQVQIHFQYNKRE